MHSPVTLALLASLLTATITPTLAFPHILSRHSKTEDLRQATISSLKPIPSYALIAGVLSPSQSKDSDQARRLWDEIIEQDYGDLGGEKPIVKARKGIWESLGWSTKGKEAVSGSDAVAESELSQLDEARGSVVDGGDNTQKKVDRKGDEENKVEM